MGIKGTYTERDRRPARKRHSYYAQIHVIAKAFVV
jgi:hypothetical protein